MYIYICVYIYLFIYLYALAVTTAMRQIDSLKACALHPSTHLKLLKHSRFNRVL